MNKLSRQVRFSVNPFLEKDEEGANSFASKPSGEGLAIFFELCVSLAGKVSADTGFVVNVLDIDKKVRENVVPAFADKLREHFRGGGHIGIGEITQFLKLTKEKLKGAFGESILSDLSLKLNPFRKVAVDCEDLKMIYFSEKFEFAAMHKLWNDDFSEQQNFEVFGKCANPTGHGHNYVVEVTVKMQTEANRFKTGQFEKTVTDELITLIDHKNLNADIDYFKTTIPTVENIAVFCWDKLAGKFADAGLHCVTIWETDRTYSSYYG
ncbi:MAG: 6-carboxytetrahydropterin synthase [Planctomycetota bacterium]|jgi:6-pyruvoyltetrahydropterin/6-carboxytetrahydropterin synthase